MLIEKIKEKLGNIKLTPQPDLDRLMQCQNAYLLDEKGIVTGLNLSGNRLTNQQLDFIWQISSLQALNLNENQLPSLNIPKGMEALRLLNVSENGMLKTLTFETGLPKLEKVDCSECALEGLVFPAGFEALQMVEAQKNQLRSCVFEGDYPNLKFLDLNGNQLEALTLPDSLPALELLFLQNGNKIQDIRFLSKAVAIQTLNISGNGVTDLSSIRHLLEHIPFKWKKSGNGVLVEDCPLNSPPPEIVKQGNKSIQNYFAEQDRQGIDNLYEAKLLIVGEGGAGKTSLCRRLIDPGLPLPEVSESTKGIDIHYYEFRRDDGNLFRVNVWDFGGQEIYHATHQFFLTKRSLYILLDDTKKDHKTIHDEGFKFWLEVIELLSGKSPLLIFQNEKGDRTKAIDMAGIRGRFGNVKDRYSGNLASRNSVDSIKNAIEFYIQELPHIGEKLPKKWINIRTEIEKLAQEEPYISQKNYFKIYEKHLTDDRDRALYLSQYLHDLGVFLHFQDDDILAKTVILQNTWATEAVYKIIDDEMVKRALGRFTAEDCKRVWEASNYADMHFELRRLMIKFELCYPLRDVQPETWLVPQLLPPSKPERLNDWEQAGDLSIRYRYDFMPKGLINRLMVRQHRFVKQPELGWKNGALFEKENTQLLAVISTKGDEIILRTRGTECKDLLSIISGDLEAINLTFGGLAEKVVKRIPCICNQCINNTKPEFYNYKDLIRRKEANKSTIECRASFNDVSVQELLNGLKGGEKKIEKVHKKSNGTKKVFFSYSKHDRTFLEEFQRHLGVLKRQGKILPWDDHRILPGEEWDATIKDELSSANIILLLVSVDFLNTDYIWDIEIKEAMYRHEQGEAHVIPVILRPCDWTGTIFSKLNGLPRKGKTVSSFEDRDEAWLNVVNEIKQLL